MSGDRETSRYGRAPKGFAPGAALDRYHSRILLAAGFQFGYPLFSIPNHSEAEDLQTIIHALTFPRGGDYNDPVTQQLPIIRTGALVPDDSGYGVVYFTPMSVREVRRRWDGGGMPHWYLRGSLVERDPDRRWFIDRKLVISCQMHLLLENQTAFVQLVPHGVNGPLPLATTEELRWGDPSSRSLPPKATD